MASGLSSSFSPISVAQEGQAETFLSYDLSAVVASGTAEIINILTLESPYLIGGLRVELN